jgi:Na+/serine symporter
MEFFPLLIFQILIMLILVIAFALILYKLYKRLNVTYPLFVSALAAITFLLIFNVGNLLSAIAFSSNILFSIMVYLVAINQRENFE